MYKNVVAVYGVPRSGTSWLGQIIDSCPDVAFRFQPLFSYRFKNRITTESTSEDIEDFFRELYCEDKDEFLNQSDKKKSGIYPIFKEKISDPSILSYKEAKYLYTVPLLLERCKKIKIVGIVRNPYDVLESWINAPSEFRKGWDIMDEWKFATGKNEFRPENYFGYYKWKECIKLNAEMKKKYPNNFITVRYEDLSENAIDVSKHMFSFLDMIYTDQTENFIKESQSKTVDNVYTVYRKKNEIRKRQFYLPEEVKLKISKDLSDFEEAGSFGYF